VREPPVFGKTIFAKIKRREEGKRKEGIKNDFETTDEHEWARIKRKRKRNKRIFLGTKERTKYFFF
jgi:hypothetical protein